MAVQYPLDPRKPDQIQILHMMEDVVSQYQGSPLVRETAVGQLRGLANNDLRGQVRRLVQFVKDNVTYVRDPDGAEYLITPDRLLTTWHQSGFMAGDCDDHVMLLNALLGSVGIPTKCVGVKFGNSTDFNHVISGVYCCGQMFLIDPCAKGKSQPVYNETLMT